MLPAELYNYYFNNALLALMVVTFFVYAQGMAKLSLIEGYNKVNDWVIIGIITFFIGTRPIAGAFVDMTTYAATYEQVALGASMGLYDWLFNFLMISMSPYFSAETFFLTCAALYIIPLAVACKRIHANWGFAAFLAFIGAFSFFTYGVNGIRNGIATSLVVLAISYSDRKKAMALIMIAAIGFHKSAALPVAAFLVSLMMSRVGIYATAWIVCLALTSLFGEGLSPLLASYLPVGDDMRLEGYTQGMGMDRGGFRWDFILYSIVPVITSYALAEHRVRHEIFYRRLLSTYLIANTFWLLMMYAAFSNRFAYLSWFLLPWVIIYPYIPYGAADKGNPQGTQQGHARLGLLGAALVVHHSFTYVMNVFIYPSQR